MSSSDPDLIQDFIDIKKFDPGLVLSLDSPISLPMQTYVFSKYITINMQFKMLDGATYGSKTSSSVTNGRTFAVYANDQKFIITLPYDYPLFSFDCQVTFKNAEVINYARAICNSTGIDIDDLTPSSTFTINDIKYVILNDTNFIKSLNSLGFFPAIDPDPPCLSVPAAELLALVAMKEWKFRVRLNSTMFYTAVYDNYGYFVTEYKTSIISAFTDNIPDFINWVNYFITFCV